MSSTAPRHRVVIASTGGWDFPSTRDRFKPLAETGQWSVGAYSVPWRPGSGHIAHLVELARGSTLLILQRVMPDREQMAILRSRYQGIIFDIDDAIYAAASNLDENHLMRVGKSLARRAMRGTPWASPRRRPLLETIRDVDVCVVGNEILGDYLRPHTRRVEEIPTTVEVLPRPPRKHNSIPTVLWIGVAANLQYLRLVEDALAIVRRTLDFELRIASSEPWVSTAVASVFVPWSLDEQTRQLVAADIGIAPLTDEPWTRGKCGFRSLLYSSCAVPPIASPVGVTDQVVRHGDTGLLARSRDEWVDALYLLLRDATTRVRMGHAALDHVRRNYSNDLARARWTEVLRSTS